MKNKEKKKLSKRTAIAQFRRMWRWLAEHPGKDKDDWPEWKENGGKIPDYLNDCSLCEHKRQNYGFNGRSSDCWNDCIIVWPGKNCTTDISSPFLSWHYPNSLKAKAKLAKAVSELPERKKKNATD